MLGGYGDILYESKSEAQKAKKRHDDLQYFAVMDSGDYFRYRFTMRTDRMPTSGGQQIGLTDVTDWDRKNIPRGCIGAQIELDGARFLTTVKHGLVRHRLTKAARFMQIMITSYRGKPGNVPLANVAPDMFWEAVSQIIGVSEVCNLSRTGL